jgi:peptidoglycan-N-acetylglucosamine deacetylase
MTRIPRYPIFYDPYQKRRLGFRWVVITVSIGLLFLLSILTISIFTNPELPSLNLSMAENKSSSSPLNKDLNSKNHHRSSTAQRPERIPITGSPKAVNNKSEVIGFLVNWDNKSFIALKQHISQIDKLIPEWLHLDQEDGTILLDDPRKQERILAYIHRYRSDLKIIPMINNYDNVTESWNQKRLGAMLANPKSRQRNIKNLLNFVQSNHFQGISIDFENVAVASQLDLVTFMQELHDQFSPLGLEISQSLPLNDLSFNYRSLAQFNDYLILMAYDEHATAEQAGSIASQSWYTQNLEERLIELPPDKYVVAIGNYGSDWHGKTMSTVTFDDAIQIARKFNREIKLDPASLNQTFDYDDEEHHQIYFLDAITAFNQVATAQKYGVRGFALWRLGAEDPSIWQVFDHRSQLDQAIAKSLEPVLNRYKINSQGRGEVLKVKATPTEGNRTIGYNQKSGLITDQQFFAYPSPYEIERWGGNHHKKIALTFDDGPSPEYTGRLLDILRQYHVPATFFVVGMNAEQNPDLLHRIVNEGHEIGSHTFTHPNLARISKEQLTFELNATERVLESHLGRKTLLFRPPYAEDIEPETPEQVASLELTGNLGYYTIGLQIDPFDWRNPGVHKIVAETVNQAINDLGNVVLLHDGGGDRSQTIAALPQLIQKLRDQDFELVTISNLLGLDRDTVMPIVSEKEQIMTISNLITFRLLSCLGLLSYYIFVFAIGLCLLRLIIIGGLALYQPYHHRKHTSTSSNYQPLVDVIVAAFNEDKVICKTIRSLLNSDYPNLGVFVVDDGSKDLTYYQIFREFGDHRRIHLLSKVNGGKSTALNYGIEKSAAEIIVTIDADTILHPSAIGKLVRHFVDYRVAAVAGNVKVGNRVNLLTYWQSLEYITSQNLERRALSVLNGISVVPGAIGAWRKQYLLKAGGFTHDTLAEDADLTLTLLKMGYKIRSEESAIAYTEAPDNISSLLKQRFRWFFGTFQVVWKHRRMILHPRYRAMGMVTLPNILLFQVGLSLVSPLMDLCMITSLWWIFWQKQQHPEDFPLDSSFHILGYYLLFVTVDYLAAVIAFSLEPAKEDWNQLFWLFPKRFFYRQLMYFVAIKAIVIALQGQLVGWNKLERKANVINILKVNNLGNKHL